MTLDAFLEEEKISDAKAARALGVAPSTVGRWRKRETSPDASSIDRLLRYTGGRCSIGELLSVKPSATATDSAA